MNCDLWRFRAESLLVGHNFVFDICKLPPPPKKKNPNNLIFCIKKQRRFLLALVQSAVNHRYHQSCCRRL